MVSLNLANIRQVHSNLQLKIEGWQTLNGNWPLSPEQVLSLIHQNLETMGLKNLERLEAFDRYSEHPQFTPFFRNYLRLVVAECVKLTEDRRETVPQDPPQ